MHDLSPGQEVTVSGMGGGAAKVVYARGNSVRVRILATGKERTVELDRVTAAPVSKSLSVGPMSEGTAKRVLDIIAPRAARPVPKPVTLTSPAYLAYVRRHPCCLCGAPGPSEPHHWSHHGGVMGAKVDDYRTVPLCQEHHRHWHDHGTLPGRTRGGSEALMLREMRSLLEMWAQEVMLDHGGAVDALIRAIGGTDA